MKCHSCKLQVPQTVGRSIPDKKGNYRPRDLCLNCYNSQMDKEGYVKNNGIWEYKSST